MPEPTPTPAIDPVIREQVGHTLHHLLRPDELDEWKLRWVLDEQDQWQLIGDVHARGEQYRGYITQFGAEYEVADGLDAFTDGLEDFISESRFAWGQRRELVDRPWRRS